MSAGEPTLEKQLKGHRGEISSVCFSPDQRLIASGSFENKVLLWDLHGMKRCYTFTGHDEAVMDVTFSPSGKYMASASRDRTVRLWIPTATGHTGMFRGHSQTVRSVEFNRDGSKILTASDDKIVKLWATDKFKFIKSFVGHTSWVRCARITMDDSLIASCSDDKTTKLWNPASGDCIHTFQHKKCSSQCLAWHPSCSHFVVGTSSGNVKLYDIRTRNLLQYYRIHSDAVTKLAFHPSGNFLFTSSKDGTMKILDLYEGHPKFTLTAHNGSVSAVAVSQKGDKFASAGYDKLVYIWHTNFTELSINPTENNLDSEIPNQGRTIGFEKGKWHLCYHNLKYPVVSFEHVDDVTGYQSRVTSFEEPNANSTLLNSQPGSGVRVEASTPRSGGSAGGLGSWSDEPSNDVGHMSHIPRKPPTPGTYTIPSLNKSTRESCHEENLFGMIRLKETDVCYTSGTIEWVGKKRSYPVNCGFKVINDSCSQCTEPKANKIKKLDNTFTFNSSKFNCDCPNVLPTVNAMVDHLNALHEAVDIMDLRLNNLEDIVEEN